MKRDRYITIYIFPDHFKYIYKYIDIYLKWSGKSLSHFFNVIYLFLERRERRKNERERNINV